MRVSRRLMWIAFAVVLLSIFPTITLVGCNQRSSVQEKTDNSKDSSSESGKSTTLSPEEHLPQRKSNLPVFTIYKDKSYEDAGTSKVIWEVIVSADITKENLTALLNDLYAQAQSKEFERHDQAKVIDIKVYMSKEHAASGMGQWVGWINKSGSYSQPRISFDDRQINQRDKTAEEKFGLSEVTRKEIWQEVVLAEDKATRESEQKYPEPSWQNREAYMAAYEKRDKLRKQLTNKFHDQLAKKYHLTRKQLDEIKYEGLKKSWPLPN